MTREELERVLGVVVREIGALVGKYNPSFHVIAVVWAVSDDEEWPVSRRIATISPDLVQEAWALVTDETRRAGPTEVEVRDVPENRN